MDLDSHPKPAKINKKVKHSKLRKRMQPISNFCVNKVGEAMVVDNN